MNFWPFRRPPMAPPATFQLPAAPPTGRRVRSSRTGESFRRLPAEEIESFNDPEMDRVLLLWGVWRTETGGNVGERWGWSALLAELGPLVVLPDDQDPREAELYGPIGQRWGNPAKPCPKDSCLLGIFHVGPHEFAAPAIADARMFDLPAQPFSGEVRIDPNQCNCGRPQEHQPDCPRYAWMAGTAEPSPTPPDQG